MTGTSCLSGVHSLENVYILCDFPRVFHGSLPSCTLLGRIKRTHNNRSTLGSRGRPHRPETRGCEAPSFPDGTAPGFFALCGPVWPISTPGGETTRPRPPRGDLGPTGASLAEGKETASSPGWGRSWGCDSQAGQRLGVAGASPAGSLRPAEPVVPGFLPSSITQKIRGRLGGFGVTIGVRNTKFPGGKPFLRVSPPGSTKG